MRKKLVCVFALLSDSEEETWNDFIKSDKYDKDKVYVTEYTLSDGCFVYEVAEL